MINNTSYSLLAMMSATSVLPKSVDCPKTSHLSRYRAIRTEVCLQYMIRGIKTRNPGSSWTYVAYCFWALLNEKVILKACWVPTQLSKHTGRKGKVYNSQTYTQSLTHPFATEQVLLKELTNCSCSSSVLNTASNKDDKRCIVCCCMQTTRHSHTQTDND